MKNPINTAFKDAREIAARKAAHMISQDGDGVGETQISWFEVDFHFFADSLSQAVFL